MRAAETHCTSIIGLLTAFWYILCSDVSLTIMEAVYIGTMVALAVCSMATKK